MAVSIVETESMERAYGMAGTNAIVSVCGHRYLLCDGFGGMDSLRGGMVRWCHGLMIRLHNTDTLDSLKSEQWDENTSLWDAVVHGYDKTRPFVLDEDIERVASIAGL